jgi:hypothetical protein
LQVEFEKNGIESVLTRLVENQDENSIPMDVGTETAAAN